MINQSFCLCLNQKPCSSVGQPGPLDSRRGVGEVFNFLLLLIGPLTFPLEGGDYTIPPFYLRKLTRNDMNICCGAPSLCKASLQFITQYLNSLILYLMRGWMRIISFKPEIIFLWRLFSSTFNFRILFHFISCRASWATFDPSVWPFYVFHGGRCLTSMVLSACLHVHVCYCRGVYLRGYLALQEKSSLTENHSGGP